MTFLNDGDLQFLEHVEAAFAKIQLAKKLLAEARELLSGASKRSAKPRKTKKKATKTKATKPLTAAAKKVLRVLANKPCKSAEIQTRTKLKTWTIKSALRELRANRLVKLKGFGPGSVWMSAQHKARAQHVEAALSPSASVH